MITKSDKRFYRILLNSLILGLGMLALIIFYVAIKRNTELRSKAAEKPGSISFGNAASLVADNSHNRGDYITVLNSSNINARLGFTFEAWVKPATADSNGENFLVDKEHLEQGFSTEAFDVTYSSYWLDYMHAYKNQFEFNVGNGNNCTRQAISNTRYLQADQVTQWTHIAAVIKSNGQLDIFVNGQSANGYTFVTSPCSLSDPVYISGHIFPGSTTNFFDGIMDEVQLSNIERYKNNFIPPYMPFSPDMYTTLLYHLDDQTGSILTKDANQLHNGQLNGNNGYIQFVPSTIPHP